MMKKNRRRGAAAVEFALCVPVFLPLLFGIMEYGWLFFQQANLAAAVREGARYAVTLSQEESPTPAQGAETRTRAALVGAGYSATQAAGATVQVTYEGSSPTEMLNVVVAMPYPPLIGLVPTPAGLSAQVTMLLEQQD